MKLLSLTKLAQKLLATGPHKLEKTSRRVRALYDNVYIFDTTEYVFPDYPLLDLTFEICFGSFCRLYIMVTIGLTARL